MKKGIFYDYGNGYADLVTKRLEEENILKTIIYIDNKDLLNKNALIDKREIFRQPDYDWFSLREGIIPDYKYKGMSKDVIDQMFNYFHQFALNQMREDCKTYFNLSLSPVKKHKYENSSIYSAENVFFMLVEFFYQLIKENEIEIIYFNNLPHEGADVILYNLAKILNIKTVIACPLIIFPNKFLYFYNKEDYCNYLKYPSINEDTEYKLENKGEFKVAYKHPELSIGCSIKIVPELLSKKYFPNTLTIKDHILAPIINKLKAFVYKKFNPKKYNLKYKQCSPDSFAKDMSNTLMYFNYQKYVNNIKKIAIKNVDLNKKYVFFALHQQPEITTLVQGGKYHDQLLALEQLSNLIPDDWEIYVKEHFTQTERMRDDTFFSRLMGIKKAKLIDSSYPVDKLIANSQFVSTITGSIGWEAICAGKNVLCFGEIYYQYLDGVFKYHQELKFNDIITHQINYDKLEKDISLLKSKLLDGYIDSDYRTIFSNKSVSWEENLEIIVKSLKKIL